MNYHNPHAQTGKVYWSERTIVNILKNPTYLGHMVQEATKSKAIRFTRLFLSRKMIGFG